MLYSLAGANRCRNDWRFCKRYFFQLLADFRSHDVDRSALFRTSLAEVAFGERDHDSFHAEISEDLQMLFSLWHPAVVRGDDEQREIDRPDTCNHVAHKIFVAGNIDNPNMKFFTVGCVEIQFSESEIDRDATRFLFRQTVGIGAGERLDERALAVINMTSSGKDEMFFNHLITTKNAKTTKGLEDETFDAVLQFGDAKIN